MKKIILIFLFFAASVQAQWFESGSDKMGWDDIRVAGSEFGSGVKAPTLRQFNSSGIYVMGFQGTTQNDESFFQIQMPHKWNGNLDSAGLLPHIHLCTEINATNVDTVVFVLEWVYAEIGAVFGTATKDTLIIDLDSYDAWEHRLEPFSVIQKSSRSVSQMFLFRLTRLQDHTKDNFSGWILVLEWDMHYKESEVGSRNIYTR